MSLLVGKLEINRIQNYFLGKVQHWDVINVVILSQSTRNSFPALFQRQCKARHLFISLRKLWEQWVWMEDVKQAVLNMNALSTRYHQYFAYIFRCFSAAPMAWLPAAMLNVFMCYPAPYVLLQSHTLFLKFGLNRKLDLNSERSRSDDDNNKWRWKLVCKVIIIQGLITTPVSHIGGLTFACGRNDIIATAAGCSA